MINCKKCNAEIPSSAKVCPSCGARVSMSTYKKVLIGVLIGVAVLVIIGCIVGEDLDSKEGTIETIDAEKTSIDTTTMGERNALRSAKNYLRINMGFSKVGLKNQLEFEGYTTNEATYAVDNCGADWKEQAVIKAKSYLKTMPFSKESLKNQLAFEGFTDSQIEYAMNEVYQ